MNIDNLREMEMSLWEAAEQLRANSRLNAHEYMMPVLGLVFLRYATNRFDTAQVRIESKLSKLGGNIRPITKDDFKSEGVLFLPEEARYDYLAGLPEQADLGKAVNEAMALIEKQDPENLGSVLPKNYDKFEKKLLGELIRIFNREALSAAQGDVFGRIYEYFLNRFASSLAQEEGQFFTPPSLVRLIVNVIEPNHGKVFDPAVGSAGMLVQSTHFVKALERDSGQVVHFIGREKSEWARGLAKLNVLAHGFNASILPGNTYYPGDDVEPAIRDNELIGNCDFVMANPPFNVDGVDPARVKDDPRLWTKKKIPGITKTNGKGGQKPAGVSNANYLWIQYFHAYLNKTGRAGFVMAASATDAGHGEQEIRREIIASGDVDVIIRIGEKFFYTRPLPCTLWFFDRGKPKDRRDKILMLDARSIFRVVSRRVHDFSEEQLANLTAIVWLYRGQSERYLGLLRDYFHKTAQAIDALPQTTEAIVPPLTKLTQAFDSWRGACLFGKEELQAINAVLDERATVIKEFEADREALLKESVRWRKQLSNTSIQLTDNDTQKKLFEELTPSLTKLRALQKKADEAHKLTMRAIDLAQKEFNARSDSAWDSRAIRAHVQALEEKRHECIEAIKAVRHIASQIEWLRSRFPYAKFAAVQGLCKVVGLEDIEAQDWSLTPGRYVGVASPEANEDEDFEARMREIHSELAGLHEEAAELVHLLCSTFEELIG